jgi:hypothetical protein
MPLSSQQRQQTEARIRAVAGQLLRGTCPAAAGALEITLLERGRLLLLHLTDLLGDVCKARGDGQADQPRLRICLLVPAGQPSHYPVPGAGQS